MKCPKCSSGTYRFKEKKVRAKEGNERKWSRSSNETICKECGYEGEE